jgi:uncharacterized protein involved in cysteine biosynthesis
MSAGAEAAQSGGALARGFGDIFLPKNLLVLLVSAALSLAFAILLWYLLRAWLIDPKFGWGWLNWLLRQGGRFALIVALLFLFPAIMNLVASCFVDIVVNAVEKARYPDLPKPRRQSVAELAGYIAKFTGLMIGINLLAMPIYLLLIVFTVTAPLAFLFAWSVNGYLLGRSNYELVAQRRLTIPDMHEWRKTQIGGRVFRAGFVVAALSTVPFVNLVMPVWAACYFTHLFHGWNWRPRAARDVGGTA